MAKTSKKTKTPSGYLKLKGKDNKSQTAEPGRSVPQGPRPSAQRKVGA